MSSFYHEINLPGISIPGNIFLAPLAGFTDRAFRDICIKYGADFTYTEMVSCEGIIRGNKKTTDLMKRGRQEKILAIQLFTGEPSSAAASIRSLKGYKPDMIDLNCGCPVPKVTKAGAGSALMNTPEKLRDIIKAMKDELKNEGMDIPVTVKIRSGWDSTSLNWREVALRAVEGGASMITVHPRTRKQGYSGKADWEVIKDLKELMEIPVIGSGDLFTPESIKSMMVETGCDGVMAARGALGNPFLFKYGRKYLEEGERFHETDETSDNKGMSDNINLNNNISSGLFAPTPEEKLEAAKEHIELAGEYFGPEQACRELKKHLCAYTKGIPGGAALRNRLVHVQDIEAYIPMIDSFLQNPADFTRRDDK
ncbi:MAG: tRNA dihydrouridine synthase DusB [Spirochaetales bacterium]|nr:tRNA dihydrouridine synthase DusB [Spirochaetales bacterium]